MQDGRDKLDLLLHSLRELIPSSLFPAAHFDPVKPFINLAAGNDSRKTFQLRKELELLTHFHLLVKTTVFGQIPDSLLEFCCILWRHPFTEEPDLAGVRHRNVDHHPDRR